MKKTVDNVKKLGMAARSPETSEIYDLMTGDGVSEHQGKAALKAAASVFAKLLPSRSIVESLPRCQRKRQLELGASSTCETHVMLTKTC